MSKLFSINCDDIQRFESAAMTDRRLKQVGRRRLNIVRAQQCVAVPAPEHDQVALAAEDLRADEPPPMVFTTYSGEQRLSDISQYRLASYVATLPPSQRLLLNEHAFDSAACA